MSRKSGRQIAVSDNAIGWIAVAAGLTAAFILDTKEQPQKWHAAIVWTVTAVMGVLLLGRGRWKSWRFWLSLAFCLALHLYAMWLIFAKAFASLRIGTLYVIPIGFAESIFFLVIILKMERILGAPIRVRGSRIELL